MGVEPQAVLTARGRGKGIGFDFGGNAIVTAWDSGAWCLPYRGHELVAVELIVDRQVAARAHRGGGGRALDQLGEPEELVRLRFVFDHPAWPDFEVDLWRPEDEGRRGRLDPAEAVREANRWLARMEALLRQPAPQRRPAVAPTAAPVVPPPWEDQDEDAEDSERAVT